MHLLGGACAFGLLLSVAPKISSNVLYLEWFFFALAGALFPDIDTTSKGQKWFYIFFMILIGLCIFFMKWFLCAILALLLCVPIISRHRGLFHRWYFITILCIGFLVALKIYAPNYENNFCWDLYFFAAGAYSHLLLDKIGSIF